jgi:hypothetical protein
MEIITGLMKLDYFLGHKYKPRKIWWDDVLDKPEWVSYLKLIAGQPERISAKLAEAGLSERELQKFIVLDVLPFRLEPVLDSISGLRFDGVAALEAVTAGNADGSAAAPAALQYTSVALADGAGAPAMAGAQLHPGSGDGRTLLIVLYQQDESQRAQYYALPI